MDLGRFLEFVVNHWALWLAFVVILGLLVGGELHRRLRGIPSVGPTTATQLINHQDALVLDVRTPEELKGSGMITGARHIPLEQLKDRIDSLASDRSRPVIVYCRSGSRSDRAAALLRKQGFESVYNLAGGILAWQNANLPLTRTGDKRSKAA